jgi:hypothetical protein
VPRQDVQIPAKTASERLSSSANHVGVFFGFVSAHSQNNVNGTTQRFAGVSQPRQCGLFVLRIFMIGAPPNAGGSGMPQRSIANSRAPSGALRMTWRHIIREDAGRRQMPVMSRIARAQRSTSGFPLGLPSPPPFPRPLLPLFPLFPEDDAMAVEFSEVDSSSVSASGVTIANLPQVAKNFRRSSSRRFGDRFMGCHLTPPWI